MKKTEKINKSISYVDNLNLSSLELERLIYELEGLKFSKEDIEEKELEHRQEFEPRNEAEAETKEDLDYNGK